MAAAGTTSAGREGLLAGEDEPTPASPSSPSCEHTLTKPPAINTLGDVLALCAVSIGGVVGFALSPILYAVHVVNKKRTTRREQEAKRLAANAPPSARISDSHWGEVTVRRTGDTQALPPGCTRQSYYIRMSDGVSIAIDVMLPPGVSFDGSGSPEKVPCVIHCARYWRAWELRWPMRSFINSGHPYDFMASRYKEEFLLAGFAVLTCDVRGAGASEGTTGFCWSDRETEDTLELIDFVAGGRGAEPGAESSAQPWSDGRVALWGISYDGGAAVRAGARGHPAVKAVVSSCTFGDVYRELFPGGIMNRWFLQEWSGFNDKLDNARLKDVHPMAPIFVKGAAPAGPRRKHNKAIKAHRANWDLMSRAKTIKYTDDVVVLDDGTEASTELFDLWSKHASEFRTVRDGEDEASSVIGALRATGVPVMWISGWSCVTASTAMSAYAAHAGKDWRLLLGPWNHACIQHVRHTHGSRMATFPIQAETTAFLLQHLPPKAGQGATAEPAAPAPARAPDPEPVRFYIDGDRPSWVSSPSWPPKEARKRPLWLQPGGALAWDVPGGTPGESEAMVDLPRPAGAGAAPLWSGISRYNAMIKMLEVVKWDWKLPQEACAGRILHFSTPPLEEPAALLGSAVLSLNLRGALGESPAADADVFAYLCEVPEGGGSPAYITEGQLRLSCRAEGQQPRRIAATDVPVAEDAASRAAAAADRGAGSLPFQTYLKRDGAPCAAGDEGFTARLTLLPVGHRFSRGSRIMLVLAPDDPAHFAPNPGAVGQPPRLSCGAVEPSLLWLPLLPEA